MASDDTLKSRSQRRRDHLALHVLGEALVRASPGHLARMPLTEPLRAAVSEARRLDGGTYRRQLRYIARLLSHDDPQALKAALELVSDTGPAAGGRRRRLQARRDRLLAGGDEAIQALLEESPGADRQRLRRMVRKARGGDEREAGALVAYLRELDLAALSRSAGSADDDR